ncbi:MAG: YdiY family protein [Verrucomicrobiia bacterium]
MLKRPNHKAYHTALWGWGWVLLWLISSLAVAGQNLVLHLKNGDRISGRLISESTNGVVLATAFAEKLVVPVSLIQEREIKQQAATPAQEPRPGAAPASGIVSELVLTNKPSLAQTAGGAAKPPSPAPAPAPPVSASPADAKPEPKPEPARAPVAKADAPKPAEVAKAAEAAKPPEPSKFMMFLKEWSGEAQFGGNKGVGTKDRESFSGLVKVTHAHTIGPGRSLRNILQYDAAYGRADGVLSDNRMDGTWKVDYDLKKRFLLYNAFRAGYNEVRSIDFQYNFGPGLGYKWIVLTNFVFKNELGGDYEEQYFANDDRKSRYSLRLAEDLWWQVTPKLRLDEKLEVFPAVEDLSDFRLRFEANLSYLLRQNLTLTLNVVDLYDTSVPPGVSRNDLQIRSLLGIKF